MTDIASVSLEEPLADLAQRLGASFEEFGFAIVRDHGISDDHIARAWEVTRKFFALPEEVKRAYHLQGKAGARGYTPFGVEQAKDAHVRDLKEFWHVGRTLEPGDPLEAFMPPNVWPDEVAGFRQALEVLYADFEASGARILQAIAVYLGEDRDFFAPTVDKGNSVMRLLHYPPVPADAQGAIRAAAHEDINTITLLLGAEESGLELKTRSGEWLAIAPPEGAMVVNIGDMLQRLTNGHLRSTTHRVVNPSGGAGQRPRYSMPFFLHFRPDYLIEPMAQFIDDAHPNPPAPITAEDYLQERLREIKLA
ncbi:isopenicillin N synthase family oxygenase [Alteraurantiacibacter aestuarii]|uniref:2-oxoglutarate-dependent ethylene/succinate-forming enzyme n=1 Tax=Alteraurantiacibacter aestuarii TaxID=650004 RepID=A0A844ZMW3_9SPHN|nr:isopenicillin N synthase family oxygenase [Alteraurantiacibacter aestuarii]MXO89185.1 isopenicillin N synthase family oxygenase [Alteraurantiacibacter aestuarii]